MLGSVKGDLLVSLASTGEWTDVASANRAVLGLVVNDETGETELVRFSGAAGAPGAAVGGCDGSAIGSLSRVNEVQ